MEPTPAAPTPPNVGAPLVEYIRTQRQNAGSVLAILALLFLALTVFLALKAFRAPASAEKPADRQLKEDVLDPSRLEEEKKPEVVDSRRDDYMIGWMASLGAFLAVAGVAAWLLAAPPAPEEARQRSDARVAILTLGSALGTLAIVAGIILFYQWRDSLTGWLDRGETKQARWVLIPLLMIVAGSGLIFFAIQPARAEERNNAAIRRTVYWTNFGLTALLLLVAFVVANVLFSLKVPNKLDTTATGFYALSEPTKNLLGRLSEPVTAYAVRLPSSDRIANDIRQLLLACQDASNGKFQVKIVNEVANRDELINLVNKYPQLKLALSEGVAFGAEEESGAVLLTTGEDEKRHAVIPSGEFTTRGENRQVVFQGEARLFKEVAFLADSQTKAVIYFTQGHRELDINGGPDTEPERTVTRFKAYLEKNYNDIRSLTFQPDKPTVPADADIVVVADPLVPFSAAEVDALRAYVNNPAKKGKFIVLAGGNAGSDRKMIKTGLEGLLAEFNAQLGTKFIYQLTPELELAPNHLIGVIAPRNPVLQSIVKVSPFIRLGEARQVEVLQTSPALKASPLIYSSPELRTWLEDEQILDYRAVLTPMLRSTDAQRAKGLTTSPRVLAVSVTEGATARAAVFGNSYFISDDIMRQSQSGAEPLPFYVIQATIDWLRDRPSIAGAEIESKRYSQYRFPQPASVDTMRLLYLPLGLAFLTVLGLGAGVWVIRRR